MEEGMGSPEGKLTSTQFEIMQLAWDCDEGLTVVEIWDSVRRDRDVSRTTILNLVDRLEKRGWLTRRRQDGVYRYRPAVDRKSTERKLAADFVGEFFGGSATNLVQSLLGSNQVSKAELRRLKALLRGDSRKKAKGK
jgi:predicted transcriptional regulator